MPRGANITSLSPRDADSPLAKQLRETLNAVPAHAWYALPSGALLFVNERAADNGGLPKDHPLRFGIDIGAPWDSHIPYLHPDDHEETRRNWSERLRTETGGEVTYRIRNASGEYRWFIGRVEPLRGSDGRLLYWVGINLDVEERMQAEKALRAGEEQLRQILDLTPQNIAVLGPHSERLYLNRTALEYHGITLDEWRARRRGSEVHPDDQGPFQSQWDRALSEGSGFEIEVRLRKSDRTYRWFLARHNLVRDSDGQILRWHVGCTDIDDRKQHEEMLQRENAALRAEISQSSMFDQIVGSSVPLRTVLAAVDKVASTDATILILGETGTGKELIARAIHRRSKRAAHPFIGVNCGAIPASLVASELFGHEKGSFTGATQRHLGRFEAANGGTIFLDEVGDLPPDVQIALLRVLQEREIERVGGDRPISIDVRVLAATHRNLEKLVNEGKFREDLFYRLNVVPMTMPPLRERATDIPVLAEYFIERIGKRVGKTFRAIKKGTMEILQAYSWPGNVRELQNVIERAITLSDSDTFVVDKTWLRRQPVVGHQPDAPSSGTLLAQEKKAIEAALADSRGRLWGPTGAAEKLGLPVSTLDSKIKRLGIDKYRFKSR